MHFSHVEWMSIIKGNQTSAKLWFPWCPWGGHQREHRPTHLVTSTLGHRCNHMLVLTVHTLAPLCQNSHSPVDINSHMRMLATHVSAGCFHPCWQPTGHRYSCWDRKCQCSLTAKTHPLILPLRHTSDPDRWIPISLCAGCQSVYAWNIFYLFQLLIDR